VAEWFKAPVLKTGRGFRSLVGSNPTPSAKSWIPPSLGFRQVLDSAKPWIPPSLGVHQALDSPSLGFSFAPIRFAGRRQAFEKCLHSKGGCSRRPKTIFQRAVRSAGRLFTGQKRAQGRVGNGQVDVSLHRLGLAAIPQLVNFSQRWGCGKERAER
jgi:hypothetical protein